MDSSRIYKYLFFSVLAINILITYYFFGSQPQINNANKLSQETETLIEESSTPEIAGEKTEEYLVTKVIDGDTIGLDSGEVVRYIGIDSPETSQNNECFADEATNENKKIVLGKIARLEKDVSGRDRYGRLLRYVYIEDVFVNEYLVRQGYAKVSTYQPDVKYEGLFLEAERHAREENQGLWGSSCVASSPQDTNNPETKRTNSIPGSCKYSCDSPDRDCSDFSSQKDAQEFFDCCDFTAENDPMKLDSTKVDDGIPCESLP